MSSKIKEIKTFVSCQDSPLGSYSESPDDLIRCEWCKKEKKIKDLYYWYDGDYDHHVCPKCLINAAKKVNKK